MDPTRRVLSPGKERNGGRVVSPKGGGLRGGSVCGEAWRSSLRSHSTAGSGCLPQTPESGSSDHLSPRVLSPGKERNGGRLVSPKGGGLRDASVAWSGSLRNRRTDGRGSPQRSAQSSPKRSGRRSRRSPPHHAPVAHDPALAVGELGRTLQSMEQAIAAASKAMKRARMDDSPGATERQAAVLGLQRELWAAFDSLPASARSAVTPAQPTMFQTLTRSIGADRRVFIEYWASVARQGVAVGLPGTSSLSFLRDSASAEALYYRACLAGTSSPPRRQLSRLSSPTSSTKVGETSLNGAADEWPQVTGQQLAAIAGAPNSSKSSWALATPRRGLLISPPARSGGSKSGRSCSEGARQRRPWHRNDDGSVSSSCGSESRNLSSVSSVQPPRPVDLVNAYAKAVALQPCVTEAEAAGEKISLSLQDMNAMLDALLDAQKAGISGAGTKLLPATVTSHLQVEPEPEPEPAPEPEPEPEPVAGIKSVALLGTEDKDKQGGRSDSNKGTALGGNEASQPPPVFVEGRNSKQPVATHSTRASTTLITNPVQSTRQHDGESAAEDGGEGADQHEESSSDSDDPVEFLIARRARPRRTRTFM